MAAAVAPATAPISPRQFRAHVAAPRDTGSWRVRPAALLIACLGQILIVSLVLSSVVEHRSEPQLIEVVSLPPVPVPLLLQPKLDTPKPLKLPPIILTPPPVLLAEPAVRKTPPQVVEPPPPPAAQVGSTSITPPVAPPPEAAGKIADAFKSAVRAAVFAAYSVPATAKAMAIFGATRIGFTLTDGRVANTRVLVSSGHDLLDDAAEAAVERASYPPTPPSLRGQTLAFEITLYNRRG